MAEEVATVSWKKFFVILAGRTNGAHQEFVANLKSIGQTEVNSPEKSDYLLVLCPVASHVGADISQALKKLPDGKPAILVVMHHTFNPDHVIVESRRPVNNPNVYLTVDCLFYDGRFLTCMRNNSAWFDIQKCLGVSTSRVFTFQTGNNGSSSRAGHPTFGFWNFVPIAVGVIGILVLVLLR